MQKENTWEKFYQKTPLEKIPWQKTQADYFLKLLRAKKLGQGKALDLGCGTGIKSIALAKKGFEVTGIDISKTAIKHAKENAKKEKLEINFIVEDATDLSFLGNERFDFVLDWANLHGIEEEKRNKYIREVAKYTKKGGKLLLRCFSKHGVSGMELGFLTPMGIVYLFSKEEIKELYGKYFKILETNRSKPYGHNFRWLDEYLMERL